MKEHEFYIGWMAMAPEGLAKQVRNVVIVSVFFVLTVGVVLALQQKKFTTSVFEYGQLTEVTGIYQRFPFPSLKVNSKQDVFGRTAYITMPLVGYGKFGAQGVMTELENVAHASLDRKEMKLKGALLYSDGKTLLQIDANDRPLVSVKNEITEVQPEIKELGILQLQGEVLDPKCYFGVMKPGHGKPHRDCAIRCVAGGISPVFWVRSEDGANHYYLILDQQGKPMNEILKDHIAEPISLTARAVQFDDWTILYTDSRTIRRTGGLSWFKSQDETIRCAPTK